MAETAVCKLCAGKETETLQRGVRYGPTIELHQCSRCGLVFLWPQPAAADLDRYYVEQYRLDYSEDPPVDQRFSLELAEAGRRVSRLKPLMHKDTSLLEIGSGSGAFLFKVKDCVRECAGIEPHRDSRAWIEREVGVSPFAGIPEVAASRKRFDLIVLFHVLEHVLDPVAFLKEVQQLLNGGGRLAVEAPNVEDAMIALYKVPAYRTAHFHKAHLQYFSASTLSRTMQAAGLRAEIQGVQRYDFANHLRWLAGLPRDEESRFRQTFGDTVCSVYAQALVAGGYADTLWAIGERNE